MGKGTSPVHVVRVRKSHVDKHGLTQQYESAYLRRTWREDGKVRNETVANLSVLPEHVIANIESSLKGHQLVPADAVLQGHSARLRGGSVSNRRWRISPALFPGRESA